MTTTCKDDEVVFEELRDIVNVFTVTSIRTEMGDRIRRAITHISRMRSELDDHAKPGRKKINVNLSLDNLVPITSNDGGYTGGKCLCCGAMGWNVEQRWGRPLGSPKTHDFEHKPHCPVGNALDANGKLLKG